MAGVEITFNMRLFAARRTMLPFFTAKEEFAGRTQNADLRGFTKLRTRLTALNGTGRALNQDVN